MTTFHGEAPGRLDFMGGVADYSGSLVLEMPIRATTRVAITPTREDVLRLHSAENGRAEIPFAELRGALAREAGDEELRALLDAAGAPFWARYPAGCLLVFCRAKGWLPEGGLSFEIRSDVPQGMGVSSSAALEVATLRALAAMAGVGFAGTELAHLGQRAENRLVEAPCGLMDQLTCAYGRPGYLLPILCRPDEIGAPLPLPGGARVVGWPSGVKHAVSESPYARARAATFMGKKLLEHRAGRAWNHAAEIPPSLYARRVEALPERLTGAEFLATGLPVDDPLSTVQPETVYPVRAALRFPVEENFRCSLAAALLSSTTGQNREAALSLIGELMLQSHAGYSAMGLGSPETDRMVDALIDLGPPAGIYGARVSGGGSGGTVVVLLDERAVPTLERLSREIRFGEAATGLIE